MNKNKPAFSISSPIPSREFRGLTKLEYFASIAMQGLLTNENYYDSQDCAEKAIIFAKALLDRLEKDKDNA